MQSRRAKSRSSSPGGPRFWYEPSKRTIDLAASAVGLAALSPALLALALVIRLDSPGPALFHQTRVGKDGQLFEMVKFRTMVENNDDSRHREYMRAHISGSSDTRLNEEGSEVYLLDDDRVTRVGRFLRRTSLDELPNLFNVLMGSMSIVGPRPAIPYEVEDYDDRALRRLSVKPGMTGFAQVRGRGNLSFADMVTYDLEYIAERSLWTDFKTVVATVPAVLMKRGV